MTAFEDEKVFAIDTANPQRAILEQAIICLASGQAVIFPTDTVYGIGVGVDEYSSPDLLFQIKKRDRSKAIPWLVSNSMDLMYYGHDIPGYCQELVKQYWPGPLTLVVKANSNVPQQFRAEDGTLAMRMPDSRVALDLIEALGTPIATTSANISGRSAVASCRDLDPELVDLVPIVLDGGNIIGGEPSTIVVCTGPQPVVVRQGSIQI